ncbi:MAG: MFS transporter [Armatimonadetes bacterium]|nr:MFS transporter [Armatimonadota bacterium]
MQQPPKDARRAARFPALAHRDFRLIWIGQTISVAGTQMQSAALLWHLNALTHSPVALGLMGLYRALPMVALSIAGGAMADSADRRRVLIVTQVLLGFSAAALAAATGAGHATAALLYGITAVNAATQAFGNPARQALMPNLVPREDFGNAVSLNSIASNTAAIVGPAAAGLLVARVGMAAVYWVNAASFLAVIAALLAIRPKDSRPEGPGPGMGLAAAAEGLRFVFRTPILVWTMGLDFTATFFSTASSLLPIFATDVLKVGAEGYGLLAAAEGMGSLASGSVMAMLRPPRRTGRAILAAVTLYGVATALFGLSRTMWAAFAALALLGAGDTVSTILRQTLRQMVTPDRLRGRMTAVNMLFVMGGPQLGNLEAGLVAGLWGVPFSIASGGLACVLVAGLVWWRGRALADYRDGTHARRLP